MNFVFLTATGAYNLGDELILSEEVAYIHKNCPWAKITVFTYDKTSSLIHKTIPVEYVPYFPCAIRKRLFANIGYFLQNIFILLRADMVIIWGGSILFDNEPWVSFKKLFYEWLFRIFLARLGRAKICFWWIGIDVEKRENILMLRNLFQRADRVLPRDNATCNILETFDIHATKVHDIVFSYSPKWLHPLKKRVGFSIRPWFLPDESFILQTYDFLTQEWYEVIFLPHTFSGGEGQNDIKKIRAIMNGKIYKITETMEETIDMYSTLSFCIGMRFHAWVLSCVHEVPFLPIFYWAKGAELIKLLSLEHLSINSKSINFANFQNMWHTFTTSSEIEKERMKQKKQEIQKELQTSLQFNIWISHQ